MTSIIGMLTGVLYSIMNVFNADLGDAYGSALSSVLIHLCGALLLWPLLLSKWGKRTGSAPWYLYFGGVLGIITVIASNIGISTIGVTASLAFALLGQVLTAAIIDHNGFFASNEVKLNRYKLFGIIVIFAGTLVMIFSFFENGNGNPIWAIFLLLLSGFTIVMARISNAHLAIHTGTGFSAIINHTTGLIGSLLLFALAGFSSPTSFPDTTLSWYSYLGGPMGALSILILNHITRKLPNVQLSLLLFVGQTLMGVLLDALLLGRFSLPILLGAILVAAGMFINSYGDTVAIKEAG